MLMVLHATTGAAREAIRAAVVTGVEEEQVRQVATDFMASSYFSVDTIEVRFRESESNIPNMTNYACVVTIDFADVSILGNPFQTGRLGGNASMIAPTE